MSPVSFRPRPPTPGPVAQQIEELKRQAKAMAKTLGHRLPRFNERGGIRESWSTRCERPRCYAMALVLGPLPPWYPECQMGGDALTLKCGPHKVTL